MSCGRLGPMGWVWAWSLLLEGVSAQASPGANGEGPGRGPLVVVSSGGVSLGSYQAGFLYLLTESALAEGRPTPLWAGASAGAANSFISGIRSCLQPEPDPRKTLGHRVWIPVGFDGLFRPDSVRSDGMFSQKILEEATEIIWERIQSGLPEECRFVLAVSTTRLSIYQNELPSGLRIPRQEEKFSVLVEGRGLGRPPIFRNYVDPYSDVRKPMLVLKSGDGPDVARQNYDQVRKLLFASMAFPVAFPAQDLSLCLTDPPPPDKFLPTYEKQCLVAEQTARFVDGGVLDNSPVRHAYTLFDMGLRRQPDGTPVWRDPTRSARLDSRSKPSPLYVLLDPGLTVFPPTRQPVPKQKRADAIGVVSTLFESFVSAARSKELYTLLEEESLVPASIRPGYRFEPAAGDPLLWFMGFFETSFRRFDFALGMLDGWRFLRRSGLAVPHLQGGRPPSGLEDAWAPVLCLASWLETERSFDRSYCSRLDRNFRVLLQTSIDRLWVQCRGWDPNELELLTSSPSCTQAAQGSPRPWVLEGPPMALAPPDPKTSDFDDTMGRLERYRFEFRDLGLPPDQARRGPARIRDRLAEAFRHFAEVQPDGLSARVVDTAGRVLANELAYESFPWGLQLLVGTSLEVGLLASFVPEWRSWFRWGAAVDLDGWTSWLTPAPDGIAIGLVTGPEILIPGLTGPLFQVAAGVRGGLRLATVDSFGAGSCPDGVKDDLRCTQGIVQPYGALSLLDRFRLTLGLDLFPALIGRPGAGDEAFGARFGLGIIFY